MTIYLVDEQFAGVGLAYAEDDPEAKIVLLQDAVNLARPGKLKGRVYALAEDVERRGLAKLIDPSVETIGYGRLVEMMETEPVLCFL